MSLDVKGLRYFVQVAELGSLTLAARALHVAQPALSQRMASMEDHLGVQLLSRFPRGVELTDEGHCLLAHARDILERFRAIEEDLGRKADVLRGMITIAMPAPVANVLVVPLFRRVQESYPELRLRIEELRTPSLMEGLLAGRFDLVVSAAPGESGRIHAEPLTIENLHLIAAAQSGLGETIAFREILGLPMIMSSHFKSQRSPVALIAKRMEGQINIVLESTSLATTKRLLADGSTYAMMTWSAAVDELADGRLVAARIVEPELPRPLYLCQLRDRRHSMAVQTVARELSRICAVLTENRTFR